MQTFTPHNYQKYCIQRAVTDDKLGLLLDMGLGKTVITLTAVKELRYNRFEIGKTLVIAPKKVAEDTWAKERDKWGHTRLIRVSICLGTAQKRIKALNTPADIYVINRENVPWLVEYYRNAWPFDMVVIDELSSFKNSQSKRFKALKKIRPRIKRIIGLTGTPSPNGLLDLWAQVYLLDQGERLGKTITEYRERYFEPDKRSAERVFTYRLKDGAEDEIKSRISDICISLQAKDYLELPPRIDDIRYVKLDSKAQKQYDQMEKDMLLQVDEDMIDAQSAAVLYGKLLQMCNGAIYGENRKIIELHDCKLEAFSELVDALNGKSMLVFYNFQHDRDRIKALLAKDKLRVGDLKTPDDITRWNNKELDVLLAHPASAAYGLNLQAGGSHVVWFGLNWSLELYQQANARLHRQGQTEPVYIHHLVVDGGMDQTVMAALEAKADVQDTLLQALKAKISKYKGGNTISGTS